MPITMNLAFPEETQLPWIGIADTSVGIALFWGCMVPLVAQTSCCTVTPCGWAYSGLLKPHFCGRLGGRGLGYLHVQI